MYTPPHPVPPPVYHADTVTTLSTYDYVASIIKEWMTGYYNFNDIELKLKLELMIVMISKLAVIIVRVTRCVCMDLMNNLKCLLLLLDSRDIV